MPARTRSNVLATVDVDLGAVDVRTRLRAQHVDDFRHLVGRAEAVQRYLLVHDLLGTRRKDRRVDLAWRDRIDANADAAEIRGHLAGQSGQRRLRRRIGGTREPMNPWARDRG